MRLTRHLLLSALAALVTAVPPLEPSLVQYLSSTRPDYHDKVAMSRWLVHQSSWGTLATVSRRLGGVPFGNILSYSDGPNSTGRLLFYLTKLDESAYDAEANSSATLSVGEVQLAGHCHDSDPEDPTCAKVSLSGSLLLVTGAEANRARAMLFARHPVMPTWPLGHDFQPYELHVQAIRLLDFYGGAADIPPEDYYSYTDVHA